MLSKVTKPEEAEAVGAVGDEHGSALSTLRGSEVGKRVGGWGGGEGQIREIKELLHFRPKQHSLPVEKLGGSPKRA